MITLKQYLKTSRQPEYAGLNARQMLKHKAHLAMCDSQAPDFWHMNLCVNLHAPLKHDLSRLRLKRA
jgi:hypothetical protein